MRYVQTVMGFPISIDIRDTGEHTPAIAEAFAVLGAADLRFSRFRPDSEVSLLNRGMLAPADYSDDLREVIAIAAAVQRGTGGAFTLRMPGGAGLDADGVVKGWAVQRAADVLERAHVRDFCINAGGDIVVRGTAGDADHRDGGWNIGVRSPWDQTAMSIVFALRDEAIATSGGYERGEHIVDGRTGLAVHGPLASVSVIAPTLTVADVLATAVFTLGDQGPHWAVEHHDCSVYAIRGDGSVIAAGVLPPVVAA